MVDTNVILSSISDESSAFLLRHATNDFEFYVTAIIIEEIEKVIQESKRTRDQKDHIRLRTNKYLYSLQITILNDSHYEREYDSTHENDAIICKMAAQHQLDYICTYNKKDFYDCNVKTATPLELLKQSSLPPYNLLQFYFNLINVLENNFAFYFGFDFKGLVEDLLIFKDKKNGYELSINKKYKLRLLQNDNFVKGNTTALSVNQHIKLYIVVYDSQIRIYNLADGLKSIIDNKISAIQIKTDAILPFVSNGNFYGHIRDISMYTLQDTQRLMKIETLNNIQMMDSIEYLWGNITI